MQLNVKTSQDKQHRLEIAIPTRILPAKLDYFKVTDPVREETVDIEHQQVCETDTAEPDGRLWNLFGFVSRRNTFA